MKNRIELIIIILALIVLQTKLFYAQQPDSSSGNRKNFEASFSAGNVSISPAKEIEKAFINGGLNQTEGGGYKDWVTITYPKSETTGLPWNMNIGYRINENLWSHLLVGVSHISKIEGFKKPDTYFEIKYSVLTTSLLLYYKYGILKVGGGPALYFISNNILEASRPLFNPEKHSSSNLSQTKLGLVFNLQIQSSEDSRVFVFADLQYRLMTSVQLGPFQSTSISSSSFTVSQFNAQYSQTFVGAGLGIRI